VAGNGFSLTVETPECTDNINKGKPVLEVRRGERSIAGGRAPTELAQLQATRYYHETFARHPLPLLHHTGPGPRAHSQSVPRQRSAQQCG
jgi:hypothetical protein